LQYTGGTTGVSKGAILTHRNILANIIQAFFTLDPKMYENSDNEQRTAICPLPLYHIFALTVHNFMLFHIGGKSVLVTNPRDLKTFISIMKKHKFHMISGVNTLYEALLNSDGFKDLDFSAHSKVVGGVVDAKLHNDDFHADIKAIKTLDALYMLIYPKVFKSSLKNL